MTATTLHYLHYTTTTTPLRYNYDYSCSTPHYIQQLWVRWPLQPLQPPQQTQLQPPFGQSVYSHCHPWFTTTNLSYRFPILKLPPPPCAVLLVPFQGGGQPRLQTIFPASFAWSQSGQSIAQVDTGRCREMWIREFQLCSLHWIFTWDLLKWSTLVQLPILQKPWVAIWKLVQDS